MKILSEVSFTKYLPFVVRGRIGTREQVGAVVKTTDSELGEIKFQISLGTASKTSIHPHAGIELTAGDEVTCLGRSLMFSSSSVQMGHQNQNSSVAIPFFSTLIKFLTFFLDAERAKTDWGDRTAVISFSAYPGGSARQRQGANANARDRIYEILAKQLQHQGICTIINHQNNYFTVMVKDFVDFMVSHNLARKV